MVGGCDEAIYGGACIVSMGNYPTFSQLNLLTNELLLTSFMKRYKLGYVMVLPVKVCDGVTSESM